MTGWATSTEPLAYGRAGTRQTLVAMGRLARKGASHPAVIRAAQDVVRDVPERNDEASIQALLENVRSRMRYTPDPLDVELVKDPATIVANTSDGGVEPMDCDDASTLLSSFLGAVGIPSRFVAVAADPKRKNEFSHVYVRAQTSKGKWVAADPIVREWGVGQEVPQERRFGGSLEVEGALEERLMRGLGDTDILNSLLTAAAPVIAAKYGKPVVPTPSLLPTTPPRPSSGWEEWFLPFRSDNSFNPKALVAWSAVGFGAYYLLRRRRR